MPNLRAVARRHLFGSPTLLMLGHPQVQFRLDSAEEDVATMIFTQIEILRGPLILCSRRRMEFRCRLLSLVLAQ